MKVKTRVTLIEPIDNDPYYSVQMYTFQGIWYWSTIRCFCFRWGQDGVWSKEKAEEDALELAKRLEDGGKAKETIIYQSEDESILPSQN